MLHEYMEITLRLVTALIIGGFIGLERSYHGRPAGFRTHALVCLSTSLLMLVTVYESRWFTAVGDVRTTIDPTRMSQGVMTGIGFLGAGAIMKEGLTVRGLTTAASIWITAAIGILVGIGFYFPAALSTALTLGVLSAFRRIEEFIPSQFFAHFVVRFAKDTALPEVQMRELVKEHGFTIANLSYRLNAVDGYFEYRMMVRTQSADNARTLTEALSRLDIVKEFRISPTVD
jgi:putative Mg2+ transporter-C (MgtC) family protein